MRGLQSFRWPVKLAMLVIALLAVIAIGSGWWLPWDPAAIDLQQRLLPPGAAHWLGTDHLGRDIFSRLLAATRVSLGAVMACLLLVLLIGLAVGGCAGLLGGRADRGLMRIAELAGIEGMIELEVTVNEEIRAARPIKLEDRVKYMTEKNPLLAELRRALDLEVE